MLKDSQTNKTQFIKRMKEIYDETLESEIGISIQRSWELREMCRKQSKKVNTHGAMLKWAYNHKDLKGMERLFVVFSHAQATATSPFQQLLECLKESG